MAEVQLSHSISLLEKGCRKAIFYLETDEDAKMLRQKTNVSTLRIQDYMRKLNPLWEKSNSSRPYSCRVMRRDLSLGGEKIHFTVILAHTLYIGKSSIGLKKKTIHSLNSYHPIVILASPTHCDILLRGIQIFTMIVNISQQWSVVTSVKLPERSVVKLPVQE